MSSEGILRNWLIIWYHFVKKSHTLSLFYWKKSAIQVFENHFLVFEKFVKGLWILKWKTCTNPVVPSLAVCSIVLLVTVSCFVFCTNVYTCWAEFTDGSLFCTAQYIMCVLVASDTSKSHGPIFTLLGTQVYVKLFQSSWLSSRQTQTSVRLRMAFKLLTKFFIWRRFCTYTIKLSVLRNAYNILSSLTWSRNPSNTQSPGKTKGENWQYWAS